jgi:tripartite-type tricarboxylate transporter receptor subunit TctC
MRGRSTLTIAALLATLACVLAPPVRAQDFPSRPIHVIVPWPSGAVDVYFRLMQPAMEAVLKQPIVVENRAGANGYIGTETVARADPDGYTLLVNVSSSIVMGPLTSSAAHFNVEKDFTPVTSIFYSPMLLVVRNSLPVNNLEELIAYIKQHPGKVSFGSPGIGSTPQVLGETFRAVAGLDMVHVPYKGFAPEVQALTGGELDMGFIAIGSVKAPLLAGKMKLIAIEDGEVPAPLPKVPALTTALPGFRTTPTYTGLWAPAGTPKPIVETIGAAARKALAEPEVRAKMEALGAIVLAGTPDAFASLIRSNVETLTSLVDKAKAAGAKFE